MEQTKRTLRTILNDVSDALVELDRTDHPGDTSGDWSLAIQIEVIKTMDEMLHELRAEPLRNDILYGLFKLMTLKLLWPATDDQHSDLIAETALRLASKVGDHDREYIDAVRAVIGPR